LVCHSSLKSNVISPDFFELGDFVPHFKHEISMNHIFGFILLQTVNIGKDIPLPQPLPEWLLVVLLVVAPDRR
jgi:hypothetical protein